MHLMIYSKTPCKYLDLAQAQHYAFSKYSLFPYVQHGLSRDHSGPVPADLSLIYKNDCTIG